MQVGTIMPAARQKQHQFSLFALSVLLLEVAHLKTNAALDAHNVSDITRLPHCSVIAPRYHSNMGCTVCAQSFVQNQQPACTWSDPMVCNIPVASLADKRSVCLLYTQADLLYFPFMERFALAMPEFTGYDPRDEIMSQWLEAMMQQTSCQLASPDAKLFQQAIRWFVPP